MPHLFPGSKSDGAMYNGVFWWMVAFVAAEYLLSRGLSYLNRKSASGKIPDRLAGIYDAEAYRRQQDYFRANDRFATVSGAFELLVTLGVLFAGWFGGLYGWIAASGWGTVPATLIFFGVLYVANEWLTLPFSWYGTFVIEQWFGFNRTTRGTFVADRLKSGFVSGVTGGILLGVSAALYEWLRADFWIWAFGFAAGFSLLMTLFYSEWIVPLFNKQTPLERGELRSAIEAFCRKADFTLADVYVIDGSRRSTKANAYFTGLGPKKRIVLYDTLIQKLSVEELVAVLAHEVGHYKRRHTRQMLLLSLLQLFVLFFAFSCLVRSTALAEALGYDRPAFALALIAFSLLYTPIGLLTGWAMNGWSRRNEYQADAFAASYGLAAPLASALKKLSAESLSNLTPHPAYVKVYYSHPTLLQRIEALDAVDKKRGDEC